MEDVSIEDFEEVQDESEACEQEERPQRTDPEWSDWVLSQLTNDEKFEDKPKCSGLQRVANIVFGSPNSITTQVHQCNESYAAVTVCVEWPYYRVEGSAEVHSNNTDAPFNQYPLATAESRALARALRTALNLRNVVSAEEVSRKADISVPITDENRTKGGITQTQKKFIELMGKKYDIDVSKAIENVVEAGKKVDDLSYEEAQQVQEILDQWAKEKENKDGA